MEKLDADVAGRLLALSLRDERGISAAFARARVLGGVSVSWREAAGRALLAMLRELRECVVTPLPAAPSADGRLDASMRAARALAAATLAQMRATPHGLESDREVVQVLRRLACV